jgi:hypothetical protein
MLEVRIPELNRSYAGLPAVIVVIPTILYLPHPLNKLYILGCCSYLLLLWRMWIANILIALHVDMILLLIVELLTFFHCYTHLKDKWLTQATRAGISFITTDFNSNTSVLCFNFVRSIPSLPCLSLTYCCSSHTCYKNVLFLYSRDLQAVLPLHLQYGTVISRKIKYCDTIS